MEEIPEKLVLDIPMLQPTSKADRVEPSTQKDAKAHSEKGASEDNFDAAYADEVEAAAAKADGKRTDSSEDSGSDTTASGEEPASLGEQDPSDQDAISLVTEEDDPELTDDIEPEINLPTDKNLSQQEETPKPKAATNEWAFEQILAANTETSGKMTPEYPEIGISKESKGDLKTGESRSDNKTAALPTYGQQPNGEQLSVNPKSDPPKSGAGASGTAPGQDLKTVAFQPMASNEAPRHVASMATPLTSAEQAQKQNQTVTPVAAPPDIERASDRPMRRSNAETTPRADVKSTAPLQTPSATPPITPAQPLNQLTASQDLTGLDSQLSISGEVDAPMTWDARSSPTSASLAQTIARPETPGMIARQMAEVMQRLPDRPVELALNPEELGRVRLSISAGDAGITVSVLAERPETLDLMRRHIDQLAREFQALGYNNINFAFNEGQSEQNASRQDGNHDGHGPGQITPAATSETDTPIQLSATSGVDLRL